MTAPRIDAVVPVHSATRPIRRVVASILEHTTADVRVIVVAHDIDPEIIATNLGAYRHHDAVLLVSHRDGIRSPAGPMNGGLARATADYVSVIGSDDTLEPGALDAWLAIADRTAATTVIARVSDTSGWHDPYPPVRPGRTERLDAVKDRLSYRCAVLGLISRTHFPDLRFTEGLPSGEDLEVTARLWFTGERIAFASTGPGYLVHTDGVDRVTSAGRSVTEDFLFLDAIEGAPWFAGLRRGQRRALAIKTLRVHFFDAIVNRINSPEGIQSHLPELTAVHERLERMSPGVTKLLARVDRSALDELYGAQPDAARIFYLLGERWNPRSLGAILPRTVYLTLSRQGPLRTLRAALRQS